MTSPKATSSICGDPNQVRYQKALKEITKLINYNNELKEQLASAQQELGTVNQQFAYKDARINELVQEKEQLQADLNEMTKKYLDSEEENVKLAIEIEELKKKNMSSFTTIPNIGITQSRNIDLQIKRRPFSKDSSHFQQKKIEDLEKALAQKNQTMKQLFSSNNQLKNKLEEMVTQGSQPNKIGSITLQNSQNFPFFLNNFNKNVETHELERKLKGSEEWNQKLMVECAELKSKLLRYENTNNVLMKVRSEKFLSSAIEETPRSAYMSSYNQRDDTQFIKKAKKLQKQNKRLQKKYEENRLEFDITKEELRKIRSENKMLATKTEGYEKIIEKQEKEMEEMLKTNEKQLEYYRELFKEKLEEQRNSFSPAKNAKNLKLVQNLHAQNKVLKKKFQLISVQLTKLYKHQETYKSKLMNCENDLNEMAKDRQRLLEELSRVKGSRIERSHSKNSMIRQQQRMQQNFGNSSVIEDL